MCFENHDFMRIYFFHIHFGRKLPDCKELKGLYNKSYIQTRYK